MSVSLSADAYTAMMTEMNADKSEIRKLKEENKKLNDDDWVIDCHKALKYKCVLDEDYYLQHLNDEGQLIDPDEFNALQEENKKLKEENEKIGELVISQTDKLKEVSIKYNEGYKINQELKEEITTLVTFTIGGGDPEETSDVEKIITDTMSKEFIDNNQEHWDLIGLFED